MLQKYRDRISKLPPDARRALIEEFELDVPVTTKTLAKTLEACHISSADVVVALLHRNDKLCRAAAETVAGVKIQTGSVAVPPAAPAPVTRPATLGGDGRKVAWHKQPNPATKGSKFAAHFALVKDGMSIEQLLTRGATRSDIREWLKRDWIRLEMAT